MFYPSKDLIIKSILEQLTLTYVVKALFVSQILLVLFIFMILLCDLRSIQFLCLFCFMR
jgi:hypothetical protein